MYNPYSLEGKTILITGASSGIGRATAIECSKLGACVILVARNEERLKSVMGNWKVKAIHTFRAICLLVSKSLKWLIVCHCWMASF